MRNPNATEWQAYGQCQQITTKQVCQWTGASERTARRWINNPQTVPEPARRLITLCALGGVLPLEWQRRGFRFWGDHLHTGNGHHFTIAHLEYSELTFGKVRSLENTITELRHQLNDHREFIDYLQSLVSVADVLQFDRSRTRPSLTDGKHQNSLFHKPPERP